MSSTTKYTKICIHCGVKFKSQKISTKYCSHRCASHAYKQKKRDEKQVVANNEAQNQSLPPILRRENSLHIKPNDKTLTILKEREFLGLEDTAILLGIGKSTIHRYCISGKLKCIRMNRKIFIRRKDIDELFDSAPTYEVVPRVVKPQKETRDVSTIPQTDTFSVITDFVSASDAAQEFGVTKSAIHHRANSNKVPCIMYQGNKLYSRLHLELLYKEEEVDYGITEWYCVDDIMERYTITKSAIYSLTSEKKVPRKKDKNRTLYSKSHIDELLKSRLGADHVELWYTKEEIYEKYGLQPKYISGFAHQNNIPRRNVGGRGQYSQVHFDKAIEERNPPTVYLKVEDAADYFDIPPTKIHYLIKKHELPRLKDDNIIRVQKQALERIINPIKLYNNGN